MNKVDILWKNKKVGKNSHFLGNLLVAFLEKSDYNDI